MNAQDKQKVLIIGASAPGTEVARHLCLNLVKRVVLFDSKKSSQNDVRDNFFVTAKHVEAEVDRADAVIDSFAHIMQDEE